MFRMKNKALSTMDRAKLLRNAGTYVILGVALLAMTFFGVCSPQGGQRGPAGSAAVVGDEIITRSDFNRAYRSAFERYQQQYADQFDPASLKLAQNVMKQLVNDRILYLTARRLGLEASDKEVMDVLSDAQAFKGEDGQFSEEQFSRYLRGNGYSEASFFEEVRRNVTVQKLRRFVLDTSYVSTKAAELDYTLSNSKYNLAYVKFDPQKVDVEVGESKVEEFLAKESGQKKAKEYYESNPKEFNRKEQVKARHILVSYKGARNATPEAEKRTKKQARKRAQELAKRVKENPDQFAEVAKKQTDEATGKASGGDLGYFGREDMVKPFSEAAFSMNPGSISDVVESPFGFHIIKVEDKRPAKNVAFEKAKAEIARKILTKEKRPAAAKKKAEKVLAALKNGGGNDGGVLSQYDVSWQETGMVAADARFLKGIGERSEVSDVLMELEKTGDIHSEVVEVRGNYFILKLKDLQKANPKDLKPEKKQELASSAAMDAGYSLFSSFEDRLRTKMEKNDEIWMNPEYLALDDRQSQAQQTSGS